MKKLIALILCLLMALSLLTACSSGGPVEEDRGETQQETASDEKEEAEEQEETEEKEEAQEEEPVEEEQEEAIADAEMPALDAAPEEQEPAADAVDADYYVLAGTVWFYSQTGDIILFADDGTVQLYNPENGAQLLSGTFTWNEANEEGSIAVGDVEGIMYFASDYLSVEAVDNAWFFEAYSGDMSVFG